MFFFFCCCKIQNRLISVCCSSSWWAASSSSLKGNLISRMDSKHQIEVALQPKIKRGKKKTGPSVCNGAKGRKLWFRLFFFLFFLASHVIKTDLANHWICTQTKCSTLLWFFIATLLSKDWMCWYLDLSAFNICQRQNVN